MKSCVVCNVKYGLVLYLVFEKRGAKKEKKGKSKGIIVVNGVTLKEC